MMKSTKDWVEAATVIFHIRELNWLMLLGASYLIPSILIHGIDINQRVMPYQSLLDVITPLEWARLPSYLIILLLSIYSAYRFVKNETDTCISVIALIDIMKRKP